jgi:hypothetical protein
MFVIELIYILFSFKSLNYIINYYDIQGSTL